MEVDGLSEVLSFGQVARMLGEVRGVKPLAWITVYRYVLSGRLGAYEHPDLGWMTTRGEYERFVGEEFSRINPKGGKPRKLHLRSGASRKSTSVSEVNDG